jgi:Stress responsive A/B Barrel Domain
MYSVTRLLDVVEADRERVLGELRATAADAGALRWVVQPTLPGARNGGDILVHLRFANEDRRDCAAERFAAQIAGSAVTRVNGVSYSGAPERCDDAPGTVYRALLLRVLPDVDTDTMQRFEQELSLMPRYVSTIRAWQLSRVSGVVGATAWTHVFEQEFSDVDGLMGPYLMHPIHWAVVDRWFDPESTDVIIRDRVCHSFCAMTDPVLS